MLVGIEGCADLTGNGSDLVLLKIFQELTHDHLHALDRGGGIRLSVFQSELQVVDNR